MQFRGCKRPRCHAEEQGSVPEGSQPARFPGQVRHRRAMRAGPVRDALARRSMLCRLRLAQLLPPEQPQARLPVQPLQAPGVAAGRHDLPEHQAAAERVVPGDLPADAGEERGPGAGAGTAPGREREHGLEAEAQADAGDAGVRRGTEAVGDGADGRCLPGRGAARRQARARCRGQDAAGDRGAGQRRGRGAAGGGAEAELGGRIPQGGSGALRAGEPEAGNDGAIGRPGVLPGGEGGRMPARGDGHGRGAGQLRAAATGVGEHPAGKCEARAGLDLSRGESMHASINPPVLAPITLSRKPSAWKSTPARPRASIAFLYRRCSSCRPTMFRGAGVPGESSRACLRRQRRD